MFKLFSFLVITIVLNKQFINGDTNVENIIKKIETCIFYFHWDSFDRSNREASRIMHDFFAKTYRKIMKEVENLYAEVRESGKIENTVNTDVMYYNIFYNEFKDSNTKDLLKENVKNTNSIDDSSKEIIYTAIENIVNTIQQCLHDIKTTFENHTVDICVNKSDPDAIVDAKNALRKCNNRFEKIIVECKVKLKANGKLENEIEYLLTFFPEDMIP